VSGAAGVWSVGGTMASTTVQREVERVHSDSCSDYASPILAGEAVPTVYHSLVEAAIRDGVAPDRLLTAWSLRESLWSAVSASGAALMLFQYWWLGLADMVLSVWAATRHTKPLNVRLGYCAVADPMICEWGVRRGYLDLIMVPPERRERWIERNDELLEQAEEDSGLASGRATVLVNISSTAVVFLAKLALGIMLVAAAWREPSWKSIGLGGAVGAFFLLQSLVRLPVMLAGFWGQRRR
jgi:hypothetical protein